MGCPWFKRCLEAFKTPGGSERVGGAKTVGWEFQSHPVYDTVVLGTFLRVTWWSETVNWECFRVTQWFVKPHVLKRWARSLGHSVVLKRLVVSVRVTGWFRNTKLVGGSLFGSETVFQSYPLVLKRYWLIVIKKELVNFRKAPLGPMRRASKGRPPRPCRCVDRVLMNYFFSFISW